MSNFHDERLPDPRPKAPDADPDAVDRARALAGDLLTIGAVELRPEDPFTWSSGMQSPIYCDNRKTLAYPRIRTSICDGFADWVDAHDLPTATIAGTATAGIPHAAWLADRLEVPMAYVRGAPKSHGRQNRIEGVVEAGDDVILVEDLISTGSSALDAVTALRNVGATVHAVLAIFTYELDAATDAFAEADVPLHTLSDFSALLDVASTQNDLSDPQAALLEEWRDNPSNWGHG